MDPLPPGFLSFCPGFAVIVLGFFWSLRCPLLLVFFLLFFYCSFSYFFPSFNLLCGYLMFSDRVFLFYSSSLFSSLILLFFPSNPSIYFLSFFFFFGLVLFGFISFISVGPFVLTCYVSPFSSFVGVSHLYARVFFFFPGFSLSIRPPYLNQSSYRFLSAISGLGFKTVLEASASYGSSLYGFLLFHFLLSSSGCCRLESSFISFFLPLISSIILFFLSSLCPLFFLLLGSPSPPFSHSSILVLNFIFILLLSFIFL